MERHRNQWQRHVCAAALPCLQAEHGGAHGSAAARGGHSRGLASRGAGGRGGGATGRGAAAAAGKAGAAQHAKDPVGDVVLQVPLRQRSQHSGAGNELALLQPWHDPGHAPAQMR